MVDVDVYVNAGIDWVDCLNIDVEIVMKMTDNVELAKVHQFFFSKEKKRKSCYKSELDW